MTRTKLLFFLVLLPSFCINAQEFSLKYGKITSDEMNMSNYPKDTTACAVVLYKQGEVYYEFVQDNFKITYDYRYKIKILNQDGVKYANVTIPFYSEKGSAAKERIIKLEANAYNLENNKIVKTPLEKEYIFEEQVSTEWKQTKFSIPAVKAGTVIEYRYKISSNFYHTIADWTIQQDIPVKYAYLEVRIPEYFKFTIGSKGYEHIKTEDIPINETFYLSNSGQSMSIQSNSRQLTFISEDVPALKDEDYVWCNNDYTSQVTFELHGIQMPYDTYKPYSRSWKDIEETLRDSHYFGDHLNMRNPYKEETKNLGLENLTPSERIRTLFHFLKSKMSWNEKYGFNGDHVKQAIKNGAGNNAEFNFVLLSMLKDADIEAYPILLSRRSRGRLPLSHPSLNQINTFIIGAKDTDSTMVYLDGSIIYGDVNILPPVLMVDRARVFNTKGEGYWTDLIQIGKNSISTMTTASVNEEGIITGSRQTSYKGIYSVLYKEAFYEAKDSAAFIDKTQTEDEITINEYQHTGMEKLSDACKEVMQFEKTTMTTDDHIYLNPMVFPHITKNSFIQQERKLPVEFAFPYYFRQVIVLTIPENYEIEEIPENMKFSTEDRSINCSYNLITNKNQIQLIYSFQINRVLFTQDEYPTLRTFWETLIKKNTEQIVLKKKQNL